MSTALAIFVKTPGHSPIKTRLAAKIGDAAATAFHRLAAQAVARVACAVRDEDATFQPCWAVAERHALADPLWQELPHVWQGEGALGQRLDHVYNTLLGQHERVLLVGADAPQLTPQLLRRAATALADPASPFVLGEACDGGFWLFGGRAAIAQEAWCGIGYSRSDTAAQLRHALRPHRVAVLPTLADVDHAPDLETLAQALARLSSPLPAQRVLLQWLATRRCQTALV